MFSTSLKKPLNIYQGFLWTSRQCYFSCDCFRIIMITRIWSDAGDIRSVLLSPSFCSFHLLIHQNIEGHRPCYLFNALSIYSFQKTVSLMVATMSYHQSFVVDTGLYLVTSCIYSVSLSESKLIISYVLFLQNFHETLV